MINKKKEIDLDIKNYVSEKDLELLKLEWFDLNDVKKFRNSLCEKLIKKIKIDLNKNKINADVDLALNIFFKWVGASLIELFFCLKTKQFLDKKYDKVKIPEKYIFLNKIYIDSIPRTPFEKQKKNPYNSQNKIRKFLKNLIRFFQINSISDIAKNLFSSKSHCILFTNFMKKNLFNNGELSFYYDLGHFFEKDIESFEDLKKDHILTNDEILQKNEALDLIVSIFKNLNIDLSSNNKKFIENLIIDSHIFLKFYWSLKDFPKKLYIGTSGSLILGKLLCAKVILNGGQVINYEHGRGTILHFFVQKFFTDLNFCTYFVNLNNQHKEINHKRYENLKSKYSLHNFDVNLIEPKLKIKDPFNFNYSKSCFTKKTIDKSNKEFKILYVSTCYLGYSSSFRPFVPDIHYLYFQYEIFRYLRDNKINFDLQPHPGGYTKPHKKFFQNLGISVKNESYDETIKKNKYNLIIFDHLASTVTPHILNSDTPSIFFNFNLTEINELIKSDIQKSTFIIDVTQNHRGAFKFDNNLLKKYIDAASKNEVKKFKKYINIYYE